MNIWSILVPGTLSHIRYGPFGIYPLHCHNWILNIYKFTCKWITLLVSGFFFFFFFFLLLFWVYGGSGVATPDSSFFARFILYDVLHRCRWYVFKGNTEYRIEYTEYRIQNLYCQPWSLPIISATEQQSHYKLQYIVIQLTCTILVYICIMVYSSRWFSHITIPHLWVHMSHRYIPFYWYNFMHNFGHVAHQRAFISEDINDFFMNSHFIKLFTFLSEHFNYFWSGLLKFIAHHNRMEFISYMNETVWYA